MSDLAVVGALRSDLDHAGTPEEVASVIRKADAQAELCRKAITDWCMRAKAEAGDAPEHIRHLMREADELGLYGRVKLGGLVPHNPDGRPADKLTTVVSLANETGVPRSTLRRYRALHESWEADEAEFERQVAKALESGSPVPFKSLMRIAADIAKERDLEARQDAMQEGTADAGPRGYASFEELLAALADGREKPFGTIYADPPWAYSNKATRGNAEGEYTVTDAINIGAMPVEALAAPDCFLFMWATVPLIQEGLDTLRAWGFTYKNMLTWDKERLGMGNYFRVQTEHLLVGVRGNPRFLRRDARSFYQGGASAHSVKPDEIRSLVQSVSVGPYVELFARRWARGWASMGNEINGKVGEAPLFEDAQAQMFGGASDAV